MLHMTIYQACLCCSHSHVNVRESVLSTYIECDHMGVCKMIDNQQPIIDTYGMTIEEANAKYGYVGQKETGEQQENREFVKVDKDTKFAFPSGAVVPAWPYIEAEMRRAEHYGELNDTEEG